jgi:formylmethanofuran dehydrogenase subunit A
MALMRIAGGLVVDPSNGIEEEIRDIWVEGGRIVAAPTDPAVRPDRTLDARGYVVMPGGVDVHCHIAGSKVNGARAMRPEEKRERSALVERGRGFRSGTLGSVPSSFVTGYRYAGLGYTTAVDAAIPPLGARNAHQEFQDTPLIDKALLVLMGNNHSIMDRIREGSSSSLRDEVAWLLNATKAFGVKVVNPGGVERWKQGAGTTASWDEVVPHFGVSPRQIARELARTVDELGLPHPVHLHGLNLGVPGNWESTLESVRALDGHRAHLAHIQFHSYGGSADQTGGFDSQVGPLVDYLNTHDGLTVDVGQVMFGETTSMTADGAVGQYLANLSGRKWYSHDVELEDGCGVVPIKYDDKNYVHALQWAIGLEWFLRVDDPWKIAISTDHPNGGSFLAYPQIIALLMDRGLRMDVMKGLPERIKGRTGLADLSREYTLSEIAIITRAAPARMLGLANKGHLGPGADGDIAIYSPNDDKRKMFEMPRYVIKHGRIVVDDCELRAAPDGTTLCASPSFDPAISTEMKSWFERYATIQVENFTIADEEAGMPSVIACRS